MLSRLARWTIPTLACLLLASVAPSRASAQSLAGTKSDRAFARVLALDLAGCIQLALERSPRIAAQRASLAAAEDGLRALEDLQAPPILAPDLPVRRKQAALGVSAAQAGVQQAERETIYAVTRTYLTVLYAREQHGVARSVVDRLTATRDAAKRQLDAGARDISSADVGRATVYLRLAEMKLVQATQGIKRAAVALREAIGFGADAVIDVPAGKLPTAPVQPTRERVVAGALTHRSDLARAGLFVDLTCLEVQAQASDVHRKLPTFAAGGDIHAVQVPQDRSNGEYHPGAIPPEMPTMLAGKPADRVQRARTLNARASAVAEATANVIVLEAEDAFLRYEDATQQMAKAKEAADVGEQFAGDLGKDFTAGLRVKTEDVINARVLASQARSQYNEQHHKQLLLLAELERITGGAFNARLAEAVGAARKR